MGSLIRHDAAPTTSTRDVPPARHRRGVSCHASEHLATLFRPHPVHGLHSEPTALPGHPGVAGRSGLGIAVPECPSIAIDRVRRNHQRLPSCLLIENAPAKARSCTPRFCAGAFPIKANDHPATIWLPGRHRSLLHWLRRSFRTESAEERRQQVLQTLNRRFPLRTP